MKRYFVYLSIAAALGGVIYCGTMVSAQPTAPPTAQPMRPRIALVNIAAVLRKFEKASHDGLLITKRKQQYADIIRPLRDKLATLSRQIANTIVPAEKQKLQTEALDLNRQIEGTTAQAERELAEMSDKTIMEVYQNIKSTIEAIAVANNLDLVMCYPDASNPEDEKKPALAQLKLQTPALIPYYHRGMDITKVVVDTLNTRHPAPPTPPAPMGTGVAPTGGTGGQPRRN